MKIALFLLLCSHCVYSYLHDPWESEPALYTESEESKENQSSDESREEGKSREEQGKDDISRCADLCTFQSQPSQSGAKDLCTKGCNLQREAFRSIKGRFSKTLPELLLGAALDRCWEGCARQYKSPSPSPCSSGCDNMRKIQKKQAANTVQEPEQITKEAFSNNIPISRNIPDIEIEYNAEKIDNEKIHEKEDGQEEEDPVQQWTYVLWRPELSLLEDPHQTYARMVNMMNLLLDSVNVQEEPFRRQGKGWLDDRMQLRIPPMPESRPASLHSGEGDNFYNSVAQSLESIKEQVGATIATPGFQQDVYYFLIGLCSLLLLTAAFNSIFLKKETRGQAEDHYYLHGPALPAKLPSYDDCIKADRDLIVGITAEEIKKTPLVCQGDSTNGGEGEVVQEKEAGGTNTGNVV